MGKEHRRLSQLKIISPCSEDWHAMIGNEQVRFCSHCNLNVYNLSAMTRREAEALVAKSQGKICLRYIKKPDNKIKFKQPLQIKIFKKPLAHFAAGALAIALSVANGYGQENPQQDNSAVVQTLSPANNPYTTEYNGTGYAMLQGTVTDEQQAVIPGAAVKLIDLYGQPVMETTTNDMGKYSITDLNAGQYTLEISAQGFTESKAVLLAETGLNILLDVRMVVDGETETVGGTIIATFPGAELLNDDQPRDDRPGTDETVADFLNAAANEDFDKVQEYLADGNSINNVDEYGNNVLIYAVDSKKMIKFLIAAGADASRCNEFGVTPLMKAVLNESTAVAKKLIAAGADINVCDRNGRSALMFAVADGDEKSVKLLISRGAKLNIRHYP